MPSLAVWFVLAINRLFPQMPMHQDLELAKLDEEAYARWEMEEGRRVVPQFPEWNIAGKSLLDVGSGLGGKSMLYRQLGAKTVTGVDLRPCSARVARQFAQVNGVPADDVHFVVCDAAQMPFCDGAFEAIVSVNVFEHVEVPLDVLQECARVAHTGGHIYLRFSPWYSPWGPHLDGWINWPWPHLFFSERTLIEAANIVEARKHLNDSMIASGKLNLRGLTRLPELNRVTVRQFEEMLRTIPVRLISLRLLPLGFRFFASRGAFGSIMLAMLRAAVRVPMLRELVTTKIVCALTKEAG